MKMTTDFALLIRDFMGGIARFNKGHGAPAVRLGTEGMYLSALCCAGIIRRAFFVKCTGLCW